MLEGKNIRRRSIYNKNGFYILLIIYLYIIYKYYIILMRKNSQPPIMGYQPRKVINYKKQLCRHLLYMQFKVQKDFLILVERLFVSQTIQRGFKCIKQYRGVSSFFLTTTNYFISSSSSSYYINRGGRILFQKGLFKCYIFYLNFLRKKCYLGSLSTSIYLQIIILFKNIVFKNTDKNHLLKSIKVILRNLLQVKYSYALYIYIMAIQGVLGLLVSRIYFSSISVKSASLLRVLFFTLGKNFTLNSVYVILYKLSFLVKNVFTSPLVFRQAYISILSGGINACFTTSKVKNSRRLFTENLSQKVDWYGLFLHGRFLSLPQSRKLKGHLLSITSYTKQQLRLTFKDDYFLAVTKGTYKALYAPGILDLQLQGIPQLLFILNLKWGRLAFKLNPCLTQFYGSRIYSQSTYQVVAIPNNDTYIYVLTTY